MQRQCRSFGLRSGFSAALLMMRQKQKQIHFGNDKQERQKAKTEQNNKSFDESSIFCFDADRTLGCGEYLFRQKLGDDVVVVHLHAEATTALSD